MTNFVATCVADGCNLPTGDDFLCPMCTAELATLLRELSHSVNRRGERRPGLLDDLDDTVFKLDNVAPRSSGGGGRKGHERPMPIHLDASALKSDARNTVATWARDFAETNPHLSPSYSTHAEAAEWMAGLPGLLAQHPAADQMLDELRDLSGRIRRMIDVAPDRSYLGPCGTVGEDGVECAEDVYGLPDRATARCRACEAEIDVDGRRDYLLRAVEDELRTVPELSRALPRLIGREVSTDMLKGRIRRGSLVPAGRTARGHATYRVGDVIDLLVPRADELDQAA